AIGTFSVLNGVTTAISIAAAGTRISQQLKMLKDEKSKAEFELTQQCDMAEIDSNAQVKNLLLSLKEIELDIMSANLQYKLSLSKLQALKNKAQRLQVEQLEAEEMSINVEAARNNPNVRIYKNDSIINADRTFEAALKEAYKATKVFEFYTSQSYERLSNLFLVRMIQAGDWSLENYLSELESAYFEFEEEYGNPDDRVAVISLRDDIMSIPTIDTDNNALSQGERIDQMRTRLTDSSLLDSNGYIAIPFATSIDELSPLTRVHKVLHIEADVVGSDVGDTVGRLYLKQVGTGLVHTLSDETTYYVFPERTAVIDPFFNGNRIFEPDVYKNQRFRDRPLVNTMWHLLINQRDEQANKDINLESLSDIRFYIYYTDFTQMEEN
ncbi:MAG: hypothetical protein GY832_08860, partial [Chloroflexi bacterium]|nr:hypothetical protein [Chloroflexota bacterium]